MVIDFYASVGFAVALLSRSEYHHRFDLDAYLCVEIFPPLRLSQALFYLTDECQPTAMITWAWLSEDVQADIHATGRALREEEWNCGDHLFFNDWITPYGNTRDVLKDMTQNVFPNEVATSLRRNPDSSVRRVNRWTGINLRQHQHRNTASDLVEDVHSGRRVPSPSNLKRQAPRSDLENLARANPASRGEILQ
ncbi:toxin-activating lysine-acyltransferase [Ruegeria atlantica]|uniref:toxin-activating lysine-acyltransferase n=1 Tax=Ruegeria atlantica TaxID=81569 RepID=UPI00147E18CE|nr:toxin-activating lysine-acyltransferase [Ruegeria atlantica]